MGNISFLLNGLKIYVFLTKLQFSGARRLRDAIILGYQLQRVPGRDVSIPEWYANAENELTKYTGSPTAQTNEHGSLMSM